MSSWRLGTSQQAQDDLDAVCTAALDHARLLLKDGGRLVPFAAAIPSGSGAGVLGGVDITDLPSARDVLDRLYAAARRDAGRYRAVAFAAEITFEDGRAIRIEAEHREGVTLALRVPYRRGFFGTVRLGGMRVDRGPFRVWR